MYIEYTWNLNFPTKCFRGSYSVLKSKILYNIVDWWAKGSIFFNWTCIFALTFSGVCTLLVKDGLHRDNGHIMKCMLNGTDHFLDLLLWQLHLSAHSGDIVRAEVAVTKHSYRKLPDHFWTDQAPAWDRKNSSSSRIQDVRNLLTSVDCAADIR